jgi:hypothetical protein
VLVSFSFLDSIDSRDPTDPMDPKDPFVNRKEYYGPGAQR